MIKGTTEVIGLIGNPVEHSFSPLIHNEIARCMNIDTAYLAFRVEDVEKAVAGAYALGIKGMNVTVPHKQAVIPYLSDIDSMAENIGAVNTLVRTKDGFKGYNTDIYGIKRELAEAGVQVCQKPVVIIGAGGASRAISMLMADMQASHIYILNRSLSNALAIKEDIEKYMAYANVTVLPLTEYYRIAEDEYVVIQTTSVGLYPNTEDVLLSDKTFYDRAVAGVDIIYNPFETKFMKLMKQSGKPVFNGLKMLLYQGVAAFELWYKVEVPKEVTSHIYDLLEKEFKK